jgi:hypothetical protein
MAATRWLPSTTDLSCVNLNAELGVNFVRRALGDGGSSWQAFRSRR